MKVRSISAVSIFVVVPLYCTFSLTNQHRDDNHNKIGLVTEAFVTLTTPTNIQVIRWNHHHCHGRNLLIKMQLAKIIPDEAAVSGTLSESAERVASSNVINESNTFIPDDDSTNLSSTVIANPNTDIDTVEAPAVTLPSPSAIFQVDCDEDDEECLVGSEELLGECLPEKLVTLPIHSTSTHANLLLRNTEQILRDMHINSTVIEMSQIYAAKEAGRAHECIYANNYVDLGKIDTYVYETCNVILVFVSAFRMHSIGQSLTFVFIVRRLVMSTVTALDLISTIHW